MNIRYLIGQLDGLTYEELRERYSTSLDIEARTYAKFADMPLGTLSLFHRRAITKELIDAEDYRRRIEYILDC